MNVFLDWILHIEFGLLTLASFLNAYWFFTVKNGRLRQILWKSHAATGIIFAVFTFVTFNQYWYVKLIMIVASAIVVYSKYRLQEYLLKDNHQPVK